MEKAQKICANGEYTKSIFPYSCNTPININLSFSNISTKQKLDPRSCTWLGISRHYPFNWGIQVKYYRQQSKTEMKEIAPEKNLYEKCSKKLLLWLYVVRIGEELTVNYEKLNFCKKIALKYIVYTVYYMHFFTQFTMHKMRAKDILQLTPIWRYTTLCG